MSTPGNILIKNQDPFLGTMQYWMHAYHDGHVSTIYKELLTLPAWYVQRSKLQQELGLNPQIGKIGGNEHKFLTMAQKPNTTAQEHVESHEHIIADAKIMTASKLATLISTRTFAKWQTINEKDAPYHLPGENPDLTITVTDNYNYIIQPSPETLKEQDEYDEFDETDEPIKTIKIDWPNQIQSEFIKQL